MNIPTYSLLYAAGAVASLLCAEIFWKRIGLPVGQLRLLALLLCGVGVAGACVLVLAARSIPALVDLFPAGNSMLGALVLAVPTIWLTARSFGLPPGATFDVVAVCVPLGFARNQEARKLQEPFRTNRILRGSSGNAEIAKKILRFVRRLLEAI